MAKITIASILSGFRSVSAFNTVLQLIGVNLNDKVLYRDNPPGEDNAMKNSLDMNSNTILNLPVPLTGTEPVRFDQLTAFIAGGAIPIQEEGTDVVVIPTKLNFVGSNVTVTDVSGVATITLVDVDTFITLTDTPASFIGQANKAVTVNSGETALEFTSAAPSLFTGHTDTPVSFTGEANKVVSVNSGETALEFTPAFRGANIDTSVALTLGAGTTILAFNTENFDTDTFHDNVTNNSRLTIPSSLNITKVIVTANIQTSAPSSGNMQLTIKKNGTTAIAGQSVDAVSGGEFFTVSTGAISVVDTDFFEAEVFAAVAGQAEAVDATNFSIVVL